MAGESVPGEVGYGGIVAYDRSSVERFFVAACERRTRLLAEIAATQRRIAEAERQRALALAVEFRLTELVLDAQRQMAVDVRNNRARIVEALSLSATQAEHLASSAEAHVAGIRYLHEPAPAMVRRDPGVVPPPAGGRSSSGVHTQDRRARTGTASHGRMGGAARRVPAPAWTTRF